ncbi:hypothetical protein [Actinomycetospora lemnae]|uniref:Uncharacterized protein n=1 Tax=Actinomycetospora lemnae TaxID=3019891 RepID=A0ABT5SXV2_9PSEU|nr:hypothetical protein [Actinomycetospora sp. DW7H6]MDD7967536.1 hypothetical protein [Actinomycetospora sp. DW7H6]
MTVEVLDAPVRDIAVDEAPGRGGEPSAEPLRLDRDPDVTDQAVVDAEFVAIVLCERPWGEHLPSPRTPPPAAVTGARRDPPPHGPGPRSGHRADPLPAVGATPQVRRRTGPGPRSPPPRPTPVTDPTRR